MCQAEETWKGHKMTVSVSVKSWHILEREFKPALWAWSAPKGIRKCWFPAGQVPATLSRIGILPKGKRLLQGCRRSSESSGWAWKYPPYTHRKTRVLVLYSFSLSSSCSFSFIHLTQSPPAPGSSHTHQNKVLPWLSSVSAACWLMCLKIFEFPASVGAARNFLRLFSRLVIKTAQWFFVKRLLSRFSSGEQ